MMYVCPASKWTKTKGIRRRNVRFFNQVREMISEIPGRILEPTDALLGHGMGIGSRSLSVLAKIVKFLT